MFEQILDILSDDVDNVFLERLFFGDRHALAHRLDRPLGIAAALLRNAFAERSGEVLDLFTHHPFDFFAAAGHRVRRADVSSRCHRRDMRGHGDENTRRTSAGTARRDVNHQRHLSAEHFLDNGARGIQQSARRIHLDDQGARAVGFRTGDAFADEIVHRRIDAAVDGNQIHMRRRRVL